MPRRSRGTLLDVHLHLKRTPTGNYQAIARRVDYVIEGTDVITLHVHEDLSAMVDKTKGKLEKVQLVVSNKNEQHKKLFWQVGCKVLEFNICKRECLSIFRIQRDDNITKAPMVKATFVNNIDHQPIQQTVVPPSPITQVPVATPVPPTPVQNSRNDLKLDSAEDDYDTDDGSDSDSSDSSVSESDWFSSLLDTLPVDSTGSTTPSIFNSSNGLPTDYSGETVANVVKNASTSEVAQAAAGTLQSITLAAAEAAAATGFSTLPGTPGVSSGLLAASPSILSSPITPNLISSPVTPSLITSSMNPNLISSSMTPNLISSSMTPNLLTPFHNDIGELPSSHFLNAGTGHSPANSHPRVKIEDQSSSFVPHTSFLPSGTGEKQPPGNQNSIVEEHGGMTLHSVTDLDMGHLELDNFSDTEDPSPTVTSITNDVEPRLTQENIARLQSDNQSTASAATPELDSPRTPSLSTIVPSSPGTEMSSSDLPIFVPGGVEYDSMTEASLSPASTIGATNRHQLDNFGLPPLTSFEVETPSSITCDISFDIETQASLSPSTIGGNLHTTKLEISDHQNFNSNANRFGMPPILSSVIENIGNIKKNIKKSSPSKKKKSSNVDELKQEYDGLNEDGTKLPSPPRSTGIKRARELEEQGEITPPEKKMAKNKPVRKSATPVVKIEKIEKLEETLASASGTPSTATSTNRLVNAAGKIPTKALCCVVPGCEKYGRKRAEEPDEYGPAGLRCWTHGGCKKCSVRGCPNSSRGRIWVDDEHGPQGHRCAKHNGGSRCIAYGCDKWGRVRQVYADQYGPAGPRCWVHGEARDANNMNLSPSVLKRHRTKGYDFSASPSLSKRTKLEVR